MTDEGKLNLLVSMGFDVSQSQRALSLCNGDVDLAVDRILSGHVPDASSEQETRDRLSISSIPENMNTTRSPQMIQTKISQYSIENGRSACTCIALQTASTTLQILNEKCSRNESPTKFITQDHLQTVLISGIAMYNDLVNSNSDTSVEHLSPGEVINSLKVQVAQKTNTNADIKIKSLGAVMQGVLTADNGNGPLGLKRIIEGCASSKSESRKDDEWMALVITKTPETLCIFLPPKNFMADVGDSDSVHSFILIDSHPRPTLGTEGCYAICHSSMDDLITSLQKIFPVTELGNDVGEIMAAMYNSFDIYPLQYEHVESSLDK